MIRVAKTVLAPFFKPDASPVMESETQLCLPYACAARANFNTLHRLGLITEKGNDWHELQQQVRCLATGDILETLHDLTHDQLDTHLSQVRHDVFAQSNGSRTVVRPPPFFMWRDSNVFGLSRDGKLLFAVCSNRTLDSAGIATSLAAGFTKVTDPAAIETADECGLRKLHEETGLVGTRLLSLGYRTANSPLAVTALTAENGSKVPGVISTVSYSALQKFPQSAAEIMSRVTANNESIGFVAVSQPNLLRLIRGERVFVDYYPSTAPFAQELHEEGLAGKGYLELSRLRPALREKGLLPADQKNTKWPLGTVTKVVAHRDDFWLGAPYVPRKTEVLATAYRALEAAGVGLSPEERAYMKTFPRHKLPTSEIQRARHHNPSGGPAL